MKRYGRFREPPFRLGHERALTNAEDTDGAHMFVADERDSYRGSVDDIDKEKWKDAMVKEMGAVRDHRTWKLVAPSSEKKVIASRWVFRVKPQTKSTDEIFM